VSYGAGAFNGTVLIVGRSALWAEASYGVGASNGTVRHVGRSVLWCWCV